MIYDCFIFYNELDLLEARLELYKDKVDYFVICEADRTHSGIPKPYNYLDNIDRFKEYSDKIIYLAVELNIEGLDITHKPLTMDFSTAYFNLEEQHRRGLAHSFTKIHDNDVVLLSDLDEFPSYEVLDYLKQNTPDEPFVLTQQLHYYYVNCKSVGNGSHWNGTMVVNGALAKCNDGQSLRQLRGNVNKAYPNAGWHFSYLGGIDKIKDKIQSYSHQEFNTHVILDDKNLSTCLNEGKDIFGRNGEKYEFTSLNEYPSYLINVISKYPKFINNNFK